MTNIRKVLLASAFIVSVSTGDAYAVSDIDVGAGGDVTPNQTGAADTIILNGTAGVSTTQDLTVGDDLVVTGDTTTAGIANTGTLTQTGVANINTTGAAATTIGSATSATAVGGTLAVTGTTTANQINLSSDRITGLADGIAGTDAVNLNQLNAASAVGTSNAAAIGNLQGEVSDLKGGVASAIAIATIPGVPAGKQFAVGFGGGTYDGENAGALKLSFAPQSMQSVQVNGSLTMSDSNTGAGVGVSYGF